MSRGFLLTASVAILLTAGTAGWCDSSGVDADYAFQTSSFMRQTAYRDSSKEATDIDSNGACSKVNEDYDANHSGTWYIEQQREGWHAIAAGLADSDTDAIDRGFKIFDWGWQQQQSDGGFQCGGLGRSFHSTSFFVEAVAHACLLIQASPYASRYQSQVDAMKPKLLAAAKWMVSVEDVGKKYNDPYTHRRYLVADALGETGVLLRDHELIDHSREYVRDGLRRQDPSGFNPEKGGYDISYNSVGLNYAERYYMIVADDELKRRISEMLKKDTAWMSTFIRPDGSVDISGSTRINGANSEIGPNGTRKKLAVSEVYESLDGWAQISGDNSYADLALKVARCPRSKDE